MPRYSGPWTREQVDQYLSEAVLPLRLGCLTGSGWPIVSSLWFVYREGALWCATQGTAKTAQYLRSDPRCCFEVAVNSPPYKGVRGQGRVSLDARRGEEILRVLIGRYLGSDQSGFARWLLSRVEREVAIRIAPLRVNSWDFTARMIANRGSSKPVEGAG